MLLKQTIAFIGAGNMASSLINGLIHSGVDPQSIWATARTPSKLDALHTRFGVQTTTDNHKAVSMAHIVVLAVKPYQACVVCQTLRDAIQTQNPLVISIMAGIDTAALQTVLVDNIAIARLMPNTPCTIGKGVSALYANANVNAIQRGIVNDIARSIGVGVWLDDEDLMHTATALAGSGPAYFYLFMQALIDAATTMGLPAETARLMTLHTASGATTLATKSDQSLTTLREQVTSPNGTTARAIETFCQKGLDNLVKCAIKDARQRSIELGQAFNKPDKI